MWPSISSTKYRQLHEDASDMNHDAEHLDKDGEVGWKQERAFERMCRDLKLWKLSTFVCVCLLLLFSVSQWMLIHSVLSQSSSTAQKSFETKLYRDTRYMSLRTDSDHLWKEMLAPDYGIIRDGNANLTRGGFAAISMFHQLHCLAAMRAALQDAASGKDIGLTWEDGGHWPHCLDYFRRLIECNADATLEHPLFGDTGMVIIDGAEEVRYCKDTAPLHELWKSKNWNNEYEVHAALNHGAEVFG